MLNLKVKHKLLTIWFGSIIFALVMMAGLFQYEIEILHQQEARAAIAGAVEVLHKELEVTAIRMRSGGEALSVRDDIISSMNMIDRYQDTANYQGSIFDGEKRQLASALRQHANATGADIIGVHDSKGQLAAFYLSPNAGKEGTGLIAFENGQPQTIPLDASHAPKNNIPALFQIIKPYIDPSNVTVYIHDASLVLSAQATILRTKINGETHPVGTVITGKVIDTDFQSVIQRLSGMDFRVVPPNGKIDPPLPGITASIIQDGVKHLLIDTIVSHPDGLPHTSITNDEHYIGALQLAGHDGRSLGFIFAQRKDTLESTLLTFQQSVLVVLLLSGLLVLPVGVYFLNRTITRPIENLVICADELRKGKPRNLQAFTGTDEFNKLAHAFQDMATAVHAREDALRVSQEGLKNAQRIAHLGNWAWDIHTGSVHYSDEVYAILARTHNELNDNFDSFMACVHKDDVHSFKRRISEAMETGEPFSIEHRVVLTDGSERFVIDRGEVHIDDEQGNARITATLQDITERHMLERAKSELISTVSHELRTPLTSILGTLGLAVGGVMGELPDQLRGMLATADKNAKRLSALIDDLLDIEKISGGSIHFEFRPVTVASIVIKAQDENQAYAKELNASIRINGDIPDALVYGDSDRLAQVMANLLSNACKFTPRGQHVDIRAARDTDAGTISIAISDLGPGIPKAFEAQVFERFSQADQSLTRQDQRGGTGLGLAITKSIIDMHDGDVTFSTVRAPKPDHGTTFTITLPEWNEDNDELAFTR